MPTTEPDTEDTRIAVAQKMLRELDERAEYWRNEVDYLRRTGQLKPVSEATLNAYEAEADVFRHLMQHRGWPLEAQTSLDGG